jgi:hypothetical protein
MEKYRDNFLPIEYGFLMYLYLAKKEVFINNIFTHI